MHSVWASSMNKLTSMYGRKLTFVQSIIILKGAGLQVLSRGHSFCYLSVKGQVNHAQNVQNSCNI